MAISTRAPNTVYLGGGEGPGGMGGRTIENTWPAIEQLTPGMLIEPHNDSGVMKWGVHDSADDTVAQLIFAEEQGEWNLGVDDVYAAGDLVKAGYAHPGSKWWGLLPIGVTVVNGGLLQSNGNGMFKPLATGVAIARALEGTGGETVAITRIRLEVIQ